MQKVKITGIDTSNLETIDNDIMMELLEEVKKGSVEARDKMVKGNLKLVLSILKKFQHHKDNIDDLFQIGVMGLIKAIDNFDPVHKVKFSTYAVPMIIGEIRRYIRDNSSLRISRSLKDIAYKSIALRDEMFKVNHVEPTIDELAIILEVEPFNIIQALEAIQDPISIYSPIYNAGNSDQIELQDQISVNDKNYEDFNNEKMVKLGLSVLSNREKEIIYKRYFINKTQIEIAEELNISQAQVSRIEKNALKSMYNKLK